MTKDELLKQKKSFFFIPSILDICALVDHGYYMYISSEHFFLAEDRKQHFFSLDHFYLSMYFLVILFLLSTF